jgi:hypothetical protein
LITNRQDFRSVMAGADSATAIGRRVQRFCLYCNSDRCANKISIINSNPESTAADITLVRTNRTVSILESREIAGNGALTAELFHAPFTGIEPDAGDYIRVKSAGGLRGFQVMRQNTADIAVLAGQDAAGGGTILYAPLYVFDGFNRTSLSVVSLDACSGILQLRLMRKDGMQMGMTRTILIPAKGKLHLEDPGFFIEYIPSMNLSGYVEIEIKGIRLAGNTLIRRVESAAVRLCNGVRFQPADLRIIYLHDIGLRVLHRAGAAEPQSVARLGCDRGLCIRWRSFAKQKRAD